jgi:integrase
MKLSKLTYHNGAIKIEVYQKGQDRKRWNTGVRVDRKLLNKDKFIKPNDSIDWQTLNIQISEEKERVDKVLRQVYKQCSFVDVLKVFEILNEQDDKFRASVMATQSRAEISNGKVKRKLNGAIKDLQASIYLTTRKAKGVKYRNRDSPPVQIEPDKELKKRENFFRELNGYLQKESLVTQHATIAKHFVQYLSEGTTIGYLNLKRHYRIFDYIINHPALIEDVNDVWIRNLLEWLEKGVAGKSINSNTTDWLFGRFQCFWTWALNNNIVNKRIHWKRFKRVTFKPGFVWVNEERIGQLAKHKFTEANLEYTRMAYLIMTLTALRHSDFHSLHPDNVILEDGRWFIHKANKKTKTVFKAEVHDIIIDWIRAPDTLKAMKFSSDSTRSNNILNNNIRKMGEVLHWNEPVRIQVDADKWETKPFYEWMNCHSGRHSAVCLWLSHGINPTTIKKWTGWKGSKMIDYYADILNIKTKESINSLVKL